MPYEVTTKLLGVSWKSIDTHQPDWESLRISVIFNFKVGFKGNIHFFWNGGAHVSNSPEKYLIC